MQIRHPNELQALDAVKKNKIIAAAMKSYHKLYTDITDFAYIPSRAFNVTHITYPRLFELFKEAKSKLELDGKIKLYVEDEYDVSARTVGTSDKYMIIVTSEAVRLLDDGQMSALLGQELGHIKYDHISYINLYKSIGAVVSNIPFIGGVTTPIVESAKGLLLNWLRYAMYTADRAGAVVAGSKDAVISSISIGLGANTKNVNVNIDNDILKNTEYSHIEKLNAAEQIVFQSVIMKRPIQFGSIRIKELSNWDEME